jgi:hypothetical protein
MDGVAKAAVHVGDWKFTILFREVGLAMMLKKTSSPFVGNAIGRSIRGNQIQSAWNRVAHEPAQHLIGLSFWRKHSVQDVLYSPASDEHCQTFYKPHSVHFESRQAQCLA